MSNFKGTTGKLEVLYADAGTIITNEDGECIAHMGGYATNKSEDEANGRLFAAAPELLYALQMLKAELVLSDVDLDYIESHFRPHIDRARDAIAKALGN